MCRDFSFVGPLSVIPPLLRVDVKRVRVAGDYPLIHRLNKDRDCCSFSTCNFFNFVSLFYSLWSGKAVCGMSWKSDVVEGKRGSGKTWHVGGLLDDTYVSSWCIICLD